MESESEATLSCDQDTTYYAPANQRPRSLLIGPEKEPVNFTISLIGAPPEVEQLVEHIKSVAEQFLYHWKTFPMSLPTPVSESSASSGDYLARKYRSLNLRDLFVAPPFNELDAVAMDGSGEPKRLTNTQLKSIRERGLQKDNFKFGKPKKLNLQQLESIQLTGEFEVASLNFAGQVHRWRLTQFLQKGHVRAHNSLLSDLALAARFLIVTAKMRISGHFFSVAHAMRALARGVLGLLDMAFGVPSLLAHNLDYKIREERCRYLVAELVCRPEYEMSMDSLCSYVRRELRRATMEKFDVDCDLAPPVPYLFLTPKGQDIDLRLFSRDVIRKALPILINILERETRGWFLHFRERLIAEMREKRMTDAEIEQEVNEAVMREYLQRVYSSILSNNDLAALGDNVPQLLVQQAQSVVIMHRAIEKSQRELKKTRIENEKYLTNDFPILSKVTPWLRSQLLKAETSRLLDGTWAAHEDAIRMCVQHNLAQTAYFLSRDLAFMQEREPVLLKELRNAKTPTRTFQWSCRIWSPRSWLIRRNFQGQSELVPTVICQQATSIVTPRSDPSQPVFLVERETIRTTSTRWPLWRLLNLLCRIWCWTWNMMFVLGVCVPWASPLGLRALFSIEPFMPDLDLSQVNGTLFPRKTSVTPTLASRLIELWRRISKSRTHFESKPDTGFIGKGMTRHVNRVYNYFFKGFLGTVALVFIFPVVCILTSLLSFIMALATPLWVPVAAVFLHVFMVFVYDYDSPDTSSNRYCIVLESLVWEILIQGLLQPLVAVFVAAIVCPLASICVCFIGVSRYWLRLLWDSLTFHMFIKKWGRVPSRNGCAVRRIAGPGLALDYFFIIKPEQALAAFEAKMELDELQAYQHHMECVIMQPQQDFSQFVEACFGSFSAQLSKTGSYRALEREGKDLMTTLHEKLSKRRQDLKTGLTTSVKAKIKLNTMQLKIALQQGAHLLEKFYPDHVIDRLSMSEEEFWDSKNLQINDWAGLAAHLYTEIFSLDFLTPLAETDTQFRLDPHPQLDLQRYSEMVQTASELMGVNGLDLLDNVYAPRGNIQVKSPYLEISAFNPRSKMTLNFRKAEKRSDTKTGLTTPRVHAKRMTDESAAAEKKDNWRPWKRKDVDNMSGSKLLIPLPIPHPANIAIAIHNRDSEQPIPMDSELCWDILRAIEDCQGDVKAANEVSRFRGGGGAATESSLDSLDDLSESNESESSGRTNDDSLAEAAGGTETLPCGAVAVGSTNNREVSTTVRTSNPEESTASGSSFHWTLSNWGAAHTAARRRTNAAAVRVDLASPEDISLDTDNTRVGFNAYGTTV